MELIAPPSSCILEAAWAVRVQAHDCARAIRPTIDSRWTASRDMTIRGHYTRVAHGRSPTTRLGTQAVGERDARGPERNGRGRRKCVEWLMSVGYRTNGMCTVGSTEWRVRGRHEALDVPWAGFATRSGICITPDVGSGARGGGGACWRRRRQPRRCVLGLCRAAFRARLHGMHAGVEAMTQWLLCCDRTRWTPANPIAASSAGHETDMGSRLVPVVASHSTYAVRTHSDATTAKTL